jgi:hypothetical protein
MMRPVLAALAIAIVLPAAAAGQNRLNIFLDCEECFEDFIRSEVSFVEYVRDPADADVHVIVTLTPTGSGGRERSLAFIGAGVYAPPAARQLLDRPIQGVVRRGNAVRQARRRDGPA